ncbi:MAG: rhodanese-like domain-containing protein [Rhodospirillales bacterium]|jgi:rhodanese-related sulfurtransferase|nr:rhodanese-like domain-containing protein [Rhodospirillales bacterium]MDP6774426.1 rhodanese-like domain-containing protein [Rhodospirillales bacterium]|tara:strand:+ start:263 stop:688 length:426 start_codon:yes stop_codon:yes gene_type:complete
MTEDIYAGDLTAKETWRQLVEETGALLIDVRTPEEWAFVGVPDLTSLGKEVAFVPWTLFPDKRANPDFEDSIARHATDKDVALLFICRSGVRSRHAAIAMTGRGYGRCYNVADGFEGPKNETGHRGTLAGWKVDGLAWKQD